MKESRWLPGVLDTSLPLSWSLAVVAVMLGRVSSQAGYAVTFSFPHLIISHLHSSPFCCCLQAKYISQKIPFSIRMCASPRKKYFSLGKEGIGEQFHKQQLQHHHHHRLLRAPFMNAIRHMDSSVLSSAQNGTT